jgi:hypothetical protein
MLSSNVTFVTSYFKIYDNDYDMTKTFEKRLELFLKLADTGINICIFTSPEFKEIFEEIDNKYENVKLIGVYLKSELKFSRTYFSSEIELCELPDKRSHIKDTEDYISLMNSKIDFVKKVIDIDPFSTKYFCWFDFSLPYIFRNIDNTVQKFKIISKNNYIDSFLTIPGCWNWKVTEINFIKEKICWRFCGGFFIGDKESLIDFYNLSFNNYSEFLTQTKLLLWEVNYWAWLEAFKNFKPIWYLSDHDDSIINIPSNLFDFKIKNLSSEVMIYNYPKIITDDCFFPSSASYVYDILNNTHIINTRYVNYFYRDYKIYNNWDCVFFNHSRQIKTLNITSHLDSDFRPISFDNVKVDECNLTNNINSYSIGLEDIRLYYQNGKVKFIATNMNYIPIGKNRMIIGDYDNNICSNCKIVNMLWDSKCEKNWCPIQYNNSEKQLFIYRWSPYQVGYVDENNDFQILIEKQFTCEMINKFRGSTTFIENDDKTLIGLVHYSVYSVHNVPPTYYHSIVLISKETLLPIMYSNPFKFHEISIEFCIGFTIYLDQYLFWISQMDREPLLIKIDRNKIPILNNIH